MATTRRPQINHRECSHVATPAARKACRKAQRATEAQATPAPNAYRNGFLTHALAYRGDRAVAACSGKATKNGQAVYEAPRHGHEWHAGMATCNRCNGVAAENAGRAR